MLTQKSTRFFNIKKSTPSKYSRKITIKNKIIIII